MLILDAQFLRVPILVAKGVTAGRANLVLDHPKQVLVELEQDMMRNSRRQSPGIKGCVGSRENKSWHNVAFIVE